MDKDEKIRIGIAWGDSNSTNFEALLHLFSDVSIHDLFQTLHFVSPNLLSQYIKQRELNDLAIHITEGKGDYHSKKINVLDIGKDQSWLIHSGLASKDSTDHAYAAITKAKDFISTEEIKALISMPLNAQEMKERIPGFKSVFHYFKQAHGTKDSFTIATADQMRLTAFTNTDVPLNDIMGNLEKCEKRILDFHAAIERDFAIHSPTIAILSVNQDMEADTLCEQDRQIKGLIEKHFLQYKNFVGPFSTKKFFESDDWSRFDAIFCFYKEQSDLLFSKMAKERICFYQAGLPFVLIQPGLSVNYDQREAYSPISECVSLALDMAQRITRNRKQYDKLKISPLGFIKKELDEKA